MIKRTYKVSDLKKIINESMNYDPKLGDGVESEDKKNNEKAYKEIEKQAKDYDGGLDKTKNVNKGVKFTPNTFELDDNKTTMDYSFDYEPGDKFKKRVKAQVKGYTSELEEDNDTEERNAEFDSNEEIYDELKKRHEVQADMKKLGKEAGLTAREMPSKIFDKESMFQENKEGQKNNKMKKLCFKHTKFISENHMLSRIPEEYKVDGNKFIMKDADDTEYMVEWKVENNINEPIIEKRVSERQLTEEFNRIKHLYGYNSKDYFQTTTSQTRLSEDKKLGDFINEVKKLED